MIRSWLQRIWNRVTPCFRQHPNSFLCDISGLIHVGANSGQERDLYAGFGLQVVWVEPIHEVYEALLRNIATFPNQRALRALVTDVDDKEYIFHVANNNGASSSILDFKHHKDIWPHVGYAEDLRLKSVTLDTLLQREGIALDTYQALVMDTQGSELLVLQGSTSILKNFRYIKTEVPDFESYVGCAQLDEIEYFMQQHGYQEFFRHRFAVRAEGGSYFDITYKKIAC